MPIDRRSAGLGDGLLDVDDRDLRRRLDDRPLDRVLQRHRRRRAAVAAAEQPQVHRAGVLVDVEQLDVAAVRRRGTAAPTPARRSTRAVSVVGVQAVHEQQAGDQLVGERAGRRARARPRAPAPPPARARRRRARSPAAPAPRPARRRRGSAVACNSSSSCSIRSPTARRFCAAMPAPVVRSGGEGRVRDLGRRVHLLRASCPCRGTCARRTAGTGRSCARRA